VSEVLVVTSSALGEASLSRQIAFDLVAGVREHRSDVGVTLRDLAGIAHVDIDRLRALHTPAADRNPSQHELAELPEMLISELEAARLIVIAAPMYCYTIPSTLKAWLEHINQRGRAFVQDETGPRGLLTGKTVFIIATRGSHFAPGDPMNFQESYLQAVLGFFGMTDIRLIIAENTAHEAGKRAIEGIRAQARKAGAGVGAAWGGR
jgi:FMN-dependent NADH-azoreductase